MKSITFIEEALASLESEVQEVLLDISLSLTQKDDLILPLLQQKRVLDQTLEDLRYLEAHPPQKGGACKPGLMRES